LVRVIARLVLSITALLANALSAVVCEIRALDAIQQHNRASSNLRGQGVCGSFAKPDAHVDLNAGTATLADDDFDSTIGRLNDAHPSLPLAVLIIKK